MAKGNERELSPAQENNLLNYHAIGDFIRATNQRETVRVLVEKGYLKNKNGRYVLTPRADEYLTAHHREILSERYLTPAKHTKEMTPSEKKALQKQLEKADSLVKSQKKLIPEKAGQMTLFGGLSGNLRTCDAWFQTKDKRGKTVNRCFIYKPACKSKNKCIADTDVSREV